MAKVGSFRVLVAAVVLVCGPFFLGPEGLAQTAGIAVTTTADELNPDGECSLREAILNANNDDQSGSTDCTAGSGKDAIDVPAGTYTLTITGTGEDSSVTGDLDITGDSTINGAGAGSTIVQAGTVGTEGTPNGIDRVFDVERPTTEATFSGVAVRNGNVSASDGGGLRAYGSNLKLEIKDSLFAGNTASKSGDFGGGGGGAHVRAKDVVITRTTFSDNGGFTNGGLDVGGLPSESTLTITDSEISNNQADGSNGGAGIGGFGAVTIEGTEVSDNRAYSRVGGIEFGSFGDTTVRNSVISGNRAEISFAGGAYVSSGAVAVEYSTISDNQAGTSGGGIEFGGSSARTLNFKGTTISGNVSRGSGGGIFGAGESLGIENSTISGNRTENNGGGIYSPFGTANLSNVTVTNNTADSDGDNEGSGGGIAKVGAGSLSVKNGIVAGNFDTPNNAGPGDIHPDCSGEISSRDHILIGDTAGCTITGDTTGDITGTDPLLGPLADNGGPTKTHALLVGSPALDKADNAACPAADQRGVIRPKDGNNDGTAVCDIGAFEFAAGAADTRAPRVISVGPSEGKTRVPRNTNVTATFSEDVNEATVNKATFKLFKFRRDGSKTRITNVIISCEAANGGGGGDSCRKATLNPYGKSRTLLAKSARYKAVVTTGVKDLAGHRLDQNPTLTGNQSKVWRFTTGSS